MGRKEKGMSISNLLFAVDTVTAPDIRVKTTAYIDHQKKISEGKYFPVQTERTRLVRHCMPS